MLGSAVCGAKCGPETVVHEVELAVGGDEADGAVVLEARQPHALVELDVLQLHRLIAAGKGGKRFLSEKADLFVLVSKQKKEREKE